MADDTTLRDEYRAEFKASALRYRVRDPQGYADILSEAMTGYSGTPGEYLQRMTDVQRRCAEANHFPTFATWCETRASIETATQPMTR